MSFFLKCISVLSFFFLIRAQCDADSDIQVFLNSSNPYCTKYNGTDCACCGYSNDNLYLYDSECTVGTSSDLTSGETILKKCDTNCASGSCQNGVCQKCNRIDSAKGFYLYISPDTEMDSCVTQCEHFQGFFGQNTTDKLVCSQCPNSCTVCGSSTGCRECSYNLVRWTDSELATFSSQVNSSSIDCSQHQARTNLTQDVKYYITPTDQDCNNSGQCDGSLENPYDDINLVFTDIIENIKIGQQNRLSIEIYFLKNGTDTDHFWLEDISLPTHYKRLFERTLVNATLSPAYCEDTTICFAAEDKLTIFIKSNIISLFVTWKMSITNIIFDGSELIPNGTCYETNKNSRTKCCDSSSQDLPIPANSQSDAICNPGMAYNTLLHPFLNYDPVMDVWPTGPYSFITMQMVFDTTDNELPQLNIQGCEFNNFWYHRYARSLISLDNHGSNLNITNTTFSNFYFTNGLITNVQESIQRDTLFTDNIVSEFDCKSLNPNFGECFSLTISGSNFTNSLFGNFSYSTKSNQLKPSQTLASAALSKNEGIVLFLVSFNGPITITESTFENLASSAFSTSSITCASPARTTLNNLFNSLDRLIQIDLGHEKYKNVQSRSVINIRNIIKGITVYNNVFQNNIASTGTNFFIHNFENTIDYPIVIEQNSFIGNFAQLFGSSFVIVNYARDYVSMSCEGIYIAKNTFDQNIQCPNAAGNAIIACIPEKNSLSPIFSKDTMTSEVLESSTWTTYYPSTTQAISKNPDDNYGTITQLVFTKFIKNLRDTKDTQNNIMHPITGENIDTSRVYLSSNTFTTNFASLAQVFIQGAFNVDTSFNLFKDNCFPFSILFPSSLTTIPIFSKVLSTKESGYFTATALMLRLINYIKASNNTYDNNTQIATSSPSLTVGSAISIDRHLGASHADFYYENITNHNGLDFAYIRTLDSYRNSQTASITLNALGQGATTAVITYNVMENAAGIWYSSSIDATLPLDTSNRQIVYQRTPYRPYIYLETCIIANNSFRGRYDQQIYANAETIVWEYTDVHRESGSLTLAVYEYGEIARASDYYLYNTLLYSNNITDQRSFIKFTGFDYIFLYNNTFMFNSLMTTTAQNNQAFLQLLYEDYYAPYLEVINNTWNYNYGRILFYDARLIWTLNHFYWTSNAIMNHVTPSTIITTYEAAFLYIKNFTVENVTAFSGVMYLGKPYNTLTIYDVIITQITTSYSGCLFVDKFYNDLTIVRFTCENSLVVVPNQIGTPEGTFAGFSACFTFQYPPNIPLIFGNLTCASPRIIYENPLQLQKDQYKAQCFFVNGANKVTLNFFQCYNATYSLQGTDTNLMLGTIYYANEVQFVNSTLRDNKAYAPILLLRSGILFKNADILNNQAQISATILFAESQTHLNMRNVLFENNTCAQCVGALAIHQGTLSIQSSNFSNNSAAQASIFDVKIGTLTITNCLFTDNTASQVSSLLNGDSSTVYISGSTFQGNKAPQNMLTFTEGSLQIDNCYFGESPAKKSGVPYITGTNTNISVSNSIFEAIWDYSSIPHGLFILSQKGDVYASSSNFTGGSAKKGGAIYVNGPPNEVSLTNCNFTRNSALYGGAVYIDGERGSRTTIIDNCNFYNNSAQYEGGALWTELSDTTLTNSYFSTQKGQTLCLGLGYYGIDNVIFEGNRGYSVGTVQNSTSAIAAANVNWVQITNSSISGFNYDASNPLKASSPLYLVGNYDNYELKNVTFQRNTGQYGGAIHMEQIIQADINDCIFIGNSAIQGGAIYLDETQGQPITVTGTSTLFENNTASISGGALQYTKTKIYEYDDPVFINNQAPYGNNTGAYGVSIERIPFNQTLFDTYIAATNIILESQSRLLQQTDNNNTSYGYNYKSGTIMNPPLMYVIKDEFGAIVTTDNSSKVTVDAQKIGNSSIATVIESDPYYTAFNGYFIIYPLRVYVGPYSGANITLKLSLPNPNDIGRNPSDFEAFTPESQVVIPLQQCKLGEELIEAGICSVCSSGEYTLQTGVLNSCTRCPDEGICEGSYIFGPNVNYWRFSATDIKLTECSNDKACLGAMLVDQAVRDVSYCPPGLLYNESFCYTGWCREGYQGNLCADCQDGYALGSSLLGTCVRCSNNIKYYALSILLIIAATIYVVIVIKNAIKVDDFVVPGNTNVASKEEAKQDCHRQKVFALTHNTENSPDKLLTFKTTQVREIEIISRTPSFTQQKLQDNEDQHEKHDLDFLQSSNDNQVIKSEEKPDESHDIDEHPKVFPQMLAEVYLRILTSYIQLLAIIGTFNLEWPQSQKAYFDTQQALSSSTAEIFSFDCILKQSFFKNLGLRSYSTKLTLFSLSPFVFIIVVVLIWTTIYIIKYRKNFKAMQSKLKTNIIVSILVCLFMIYPTILHLNVQAFWCRALADDPNSTYLEADPQIKCWSSEHNILSYAIALPSLIIWGAGIPLTALLLLVYRKDKLRDKTFRHKYGFIFDGYKDRFFFWEMVIIYRKLVFIIISIFMTQQNLSVKACLAVGLCGISYLLQIKVEPYHVDSLNELEKRSLIISTVTLYCAMFQLTNLLSSAAKTVILVVLIIVNLYFFVYWIMEFLKAKSQQYLQSPALAKRFGPILKFFAEFEWRRKPKVIKKEKKLSILDLPVMFPRFNPSNSQSLEKIQSIMDLPHLSVEEKASESKIIDLDFPREVEGEELESLSNHEDIIREDI